MFDIVMVIRMAIITLDQSVHVFHFIIAMNSHYSSYFYIYIYIIGFGGLEVVCWPLVPKFAGSNSAEAVGFLRAKKSSARLPSEGK